MDLRQNQLPWSEQIWAKINADLAQALTQARRVRGPFEVFHVPDSQQTVLADKRDPNADNQFDFTESESMPIIELSVNFNLAQTQVFNEGDNFYALDRIVGAAFDLGQAEDEILFSGKRSEVESSFNGVRVSKTRGLDDGRIWEGIEYDDLEEGWVTPPDNLNSFFHFQDTVNATKGKADTVETASAAFDKDQSAANLQALRISERAALASIATACAFEGAVSLDDRTREIFSEIEAKIYVTAYGTISYVDAIDLFEAKLRHLSFQQRGFIAVTIAALVTTPPSAPNSLVEAAATALLLVGLGDCDAREAEALTRRLGTVPPGNPPRSPWTGPSILIAKLVDLRSHFFKRLSGHEQIVLNAVAKAARKGFRPRHPATVFWRGRQGHCIPRGLTGFEVYNAVLEARDRLRKLSRYEAFALLISNEIEGELQSTIPGTNSLNTPMERLRPLATAGIYSSSCLGRREMYVIAVARSWFDIAQALEPSVQFLNINPADGSYNLRLIERFAFRLKDGTARCKVVMCNEDP
jgi:hypothetical protein